MTNYANEHHFEIINIYYDDGYSGVNCHRWPSEIDDIIAGDELIRMLCKPIYTSKYKIVISKAWLISLRWINCISLFLFIILVLLLLVNKVDVEHITYIYCLLLFKILWGNLIPDNSCTLIVYFNIDINK